VIGGVAASWLWLVAPRLAALPTAPLAGGALIASALATYAIAWVALGALDAVLRHAELAHDLRMTAREHREDLRLAAADPRWAKLRRSIAGSLDATLLLLGDDVAVAIAWDPHRRPVPVRTAVGRRSEATRLLGLARRHRIAVHRDAALAEHLAGAEGAVPEDDWPRLAEIVAALR
jgi:flagellar biosynthesis protein FlhB